MKILWTLIVIFFICLFMSWATLWLVEHFRWRNLKWTQCAWCRIWKREDGMLSQVKPSHVDQTSHGICQKCLAEKKREIQKLIQSKI